VRNWLSIYQNEKYLEQSLIQKNVAKYLPERKKNIWSKDVFGKKIWLNIYQNEKYLEQRLIQKNLAKYLLERKIFGAKTYSEKCG
jgi:hypothetical protein